MKKPTAAPEIYPDLSPMQKTTQDEGMTFRLKRISDIRNTLEDELEARGKYRRRYKSIYNAAVYTNAGAGLVSACSSTGTVVSLATGIGAIASLPLGILAIATGVLSVCSSGIAKIILKKVQKHEQIKFLALSKLSSVNDLVSKALSDGSVSDVEFEIILKEIESYRGLKSEIRRHVRNQIKEMTTDKEEEIRQEAEKKGILLGQQMAMTNLQDTLKNMGTTSATGLTDSM